MLQKSKGDDLADAFRGPIGLFAIAIIVIAMGLAVAEQFVPSETSIAGLDEDDKLLFGNTLLSLLIEVKFYLQWAVYLAIIMGGIMIGVSLRIRRKPSTHDREP